MNLGIITTQVCVDVVPPPDVRCSDPEFAEENPGLCPAQPTLVIKPSMALTCQLGSVQFRAFKVTEGVEVDVTTSSTFTSSDPNTAIIGVDSGSATGLAAGEVTIAATYQGMIAHAELNILSGTNCCQKEHVAIMVLVDISKSMSLGFDSNYATRLDYAKAAASQFILEINGAKDSVGLMSFSDAQQNLLSTPTGNVSSVEAMVNGISQSQDTTSFYAILSQAVSALNATTADRKVILLISDGEDTASTDNTTGDPFTVLSNFQSQGGIVMCLGVRSSNVENGFFTLSQFSSGGFFINAYPDTEVAALQFLSGLKGYICAGNCTPAGDLITNQGQLNYTGFDNWNVTGGHVDLLGNGFLDLLPGNGLYVDLGGSTAPYNGTLTSKTPFSLISGHSYRVTLWLAGNQQNDPNDLVCQLQVLSGVTALVSQSISISGSSQGFQQYAFNFTAPANLPAVISIQQQLAPGYSSVSDPRWGLLLGEVSFVDTTTLVTLLDDTFDTENPVYVPPGCGQGTTYVYLSSLGRYGYAYGSYCYGGYGCLDSPPGIQLPDPNPLSEIELGNAAPPQQFTSTQTQCTSCPVGSDNTSNNLIPIMTGYTTPSGVVAASSEFPGGFGQSAGFAWQAFQAPPVPNISTVGWISNTGNVTGWISYQFPSPTIVGNYVVTSGGSYPLGGTELDAPRTWTFEGSNDGATWTVLDTQTNQVFQPADRRPFSFPNTTAYSYYRINISVNNGDGTRVAILRLEMYPPTAQICATATESGTSQNDADNNAKKSALSAAHALLPNCETVYLSTQQYTAPCPSGKCGAPVTMSATASSFTSQHNADVDAAAEAQILATAAINCNQCNNTYAIVIADAPNGGVGLANPWPSCACVTGKTGLITKVTVTITNFYHSFPSDIHALLMGPDGTVIYLFGHCGDGFPIGNCSNGYPIGSVFCNGVIVGPVITFDDAAASNLPNAAQIVSGTFKPTLYGAQAAFPPTSPIAPGLPQTLASFIGKNPNGTWSLWLIDAGPSNTGGIAGGWSINVTSA